MAPLLPSRFPSKLVPRVDFFPEEFRKLVATHGLTLRWEMSTACPCSQPTANYGGSWSDTGDDRKDTGKPREDCPTCNGSGYRYHSAQSIKAVVTSAAQHPDRFAKYGEMASGMISVSVMPEHRLNLGDRLTLTQSVQRYREKHKYRGEAVSETRYAIKPRELDITPAALTTGVLDVYVTDADGVAATGGEKVEGVDFDVTAAGAIEWINPPVSGAFWSISYTANPRYLVKDLPHPFRDTIVKFKSPTADFTSLPLNVICALEFLDSGGF